AGVDGKRFGFHVVSTPDEVARRGSTADAFDGKVEQQFGIRARVDAPLGNVELELGGEADAVVTEGGFALAGAYGLEADLAGRAVQGEVPRHLEAAIAKTTDGLAGEASLGEGSYAQEVGRAQVGITLGVVGVDARR